MARDDFSVETKDVLARRAGMRCSWPTCDQLTAGPREDPTKALNVGVAAHICAAAPGGPRYAAEMTVEERDLIFATPALPFGREGRASVSRAVPHVGRAATVTRRPPLPSFRYEKKRSRWHAVQRRGLTIRSGRQPAAVS